MSPSETAPPSPDRSSIRTHAALLALGATFGVGALFLWFPLSPCGPAKADCAVPPPASAATPGKAWLGAEVPLPPPPPGDGLVELSEPVRFVDASRIASGLSTTLNLSNVKDMEAATLMRTIATLTRANVMMHPTLQRRRVSLRLVDVPAYRTIHAIARMLDATVRYDGDILHIEPAALSPPRPRLMDLSAQGEPAAAVFARLEAATPYRFEVADALADRPVTVHVSRVTLDDLLRELERQVGGWVGLEGSVLRVQPGARPLTGRTAPMEDDFTRGAMEPYPPEDGRDFPGDLGGGPLEPYPYEGSELGFDGDDFGSF